VGEDIGFSAAVAAQVAYEQAGGVAVGGGQGGAGFAEVAWCPAGCGEFVEDVEAWVVAEHGDVVPAGRDDLGDEIDPVGDARSAETAGRVFFIFFFLVLNGLGDTGVTGVVTWVSPVGSGVVTPVSPLLVGVVTIR
jgi:hypothetical protein